MKKWLSGLAFALTAAAATANTFPTQPVNFVVPYSPGGLTDQLARLYADKLSKAWGQPVIVENKPGAGSSIGAAYVARSAPTGQTILLGSVGMVTNSMLLKNMPYATDDLVPVALLALAPNVLYVHSSLPVKTVGELVDYAKQNPGKLSFASSGVGSSPHLAAELFVAKTGIDAIQVPYKGTGAAIVDFLGGQVNAYFDTMQSMRYTKDGTIRALAVTTQNRLKDMPELPTVQESGVADGVLSSSWFGIFVPAKVSDEVRLSLQNAFAKVAADPVVQEDVIKMGLIPDFQDQAQFKRFVSTETDKWADVIRTQNIRIQ